jgi:hypothetical protein
LAKKKGKDGGVNEKVIGDRGWSRVGKLQGFQVAESSAKDGSRVWKSAGLKFDEEPDERRE